MKMASHDSDLFAQGSYVEVSSEANGFPGMWYAAKVLKRPPSASCTKMEMVFLVEYQNLRSSNGTKLIRHVGFQHIRPLPPPPDGEKTFEVNDVVDAYLVDGWWLGLVYEVLQEPRGYSVLFNNPPDLINFRPSDLRAHLDWVGDKWVRPQKQIKLKKVGTCDHQREGVNPSQSLVGGKEYEGADGTGEGLASIDVESTIIGEPTETASGLTDLGSKTRDTEMAIKPCTMADVDEPSRCIAKDTEMAIIPNNMADIVEPSCSKAEDVEMVITPCNIADVDEPMPCLPTIVVDSSISGGTIKQSSESTQISNEIVVQCHAGAALSDSEPYGDRNLQFLKSSPVLRFIKSMEIFKLMPQEPHFRPLAKCEEVWQEGIAVEHMMNFVNVVNETTKLQANASKCSFDSLFKCLNELELHGFDVKAVQNRLLEMQSLKESREQLVRKWKKIEKKILQETHKKTKVQAELDVVMKDIKVLEEKKTKLISRCNKNDLEITKLRSSVDTVTEEIRKVKHEFRSLSTSPWK